MSEVIVNRVSQGPHLARELEKARPTVSEEIQAYKRIEQSTLANKELGTSSSVQTAEGLRASQVGYADETVSPGFRFTRIELPEPDAEAAKQIEVEIRKALTFVPRHEFEDFKKQVIAALKHSGTDIRKFFNV